MAILKQKFPVCVGKESFSIKTTEKSCKITGTKLSNKKK